MSIYWNDGTSLYHYGIKGQRWGERRFQNPDGSLTAEGRRRYGVMQNAGNYARQKYEYNKASADEFKNKVYSNEYAQKYLTKNPKEGQTKWLNDMYGSDWKNKSYMKDVFGVDDVYKHAKEEINNEFKESQNYEVKMAKEYSKEAKIWLDRSERYFNTPVKDISKSEYKEAKKIAKKYLRSNKRHQ